MKVDAFSNSAIGKLQRIRGHDAYLRRDYDHFAFIPAPLPTSVLLSERTHQLLGAALYAVGRLDSAARRLPQPSLLVRPSLRREAISTSALEGTYAPLESVFEADFVAAANQTAEVREVLNYVRAAEHGLVLIKTKPICVTVIADLQAILVEGTRGASYDAGRLRTTQVFIGEREEGLENSRFVPPPPGAVLVDGMSDWEKWINAENDVSLIAKMALGHYQFEALHPFTDGNGRLGRLVTTLQLVDAGVLKYPILNLSSWLERRKEQYKDELLAVSRTGDFNPWTQFFAEAVRAQAAEAEMRIEELLTFRTQTIAQLRNASVRGVAVNIAEDLIGYPVITAGDSARRHGVTFPPANRAVAKLSELGIVREVTGRSYGRVFVCDDVMSIIRRGL